MEIRLHYIEQGEGFPLILLHGNGRIIPTSKGQMEPFADHFRVIAVDTRGHGESPRGTGPFTLSQFAEDLKSFFDQHGISKCHLLGFSDGGNVALLFALKYPDRVERLILNGANLDPCGVKLKTQIPIVLGWGLCRLCALFSQQAKQNWEMLNLMVTQPHIHRAELAGLDMPVLVVAGEQDMIRESHTQSIAANIPNSRLVILPGDHFIARRNWQGFNDTVLEFLLDRS